MPPRPRASCETIEPVVQEPVSLVEEPAHQPVRPPARQATRPETARPEPPKTDGTRAEAPLEAPKTEDPSKPTLQTTPTVADVEVERTIRGVIARANADLGRVNYRGTQHGWADAIRFSDLASSNRRKRPWSLAHEIWSSREIWRTRRWHSPRSSPDAEPLDFHSRFAVTSSVPHCFPVPVAGFAQPCTDVNILRLP